MNLKRTILLATALAATLLTGCASVPTMGDTAKMQAITEDAPKGTARIYIMRTNMNNAGAALYKDLYLDGKCLGETAPGTFFIADVEGNKYHWISTESEFSPNHLRFYAEADKKYYFQQVIRLGVFVGGAFLTQLDDLTGRELVHTCSLAVPGTCSSAQVIKLPDDSKESLKERTEAVDK